MSRVYLVVEGQTEETFVRELLQPYYATIGLYLTPIIIGTSTGYRGGVVSYAKVRPQLVRLCKQDVSAHVSTLFDLYALPADFPGQGAAGYPAAGTGRQKATFLQAQMASDVNQPNFIPNLMVHEFEALLFTRPDQFSGWVDDARVVERLRATAKAFATPEDINDDPQTAPSKRILAVMPRYQKTFHGPLIACGVGLDALRAACPHFHAWLQQLEALAPEAV